MKDEIKEIQFDHFKDLEELKQNVENWIKIDEEYWERWFGLSDIKKLLDYITNLQTIEQQYSAILSENAELENKITNLQEENVVLKSQLLQDNKSYHDMQGRIKKAIEYINENWGHWCSNHCKYATKTINILQGKSDE